MLKLAAPLPLLLLAALITAMGIALITQPAAAAPHAIPWDCADWQASPAIADAEDARVSVILETLAANRGKAIYCGIEESDTFTKTETWTSGRDRNERDDTVYFGNAGNFRGFLAAQEGYLTDGASGVTGVSRELIFEFPQEAPRGKKTVRRSVSLPPFSRTGPEGTGNTMPIAQANAREQFMDGFELTENHRTEIQQECRSRNYPKTKNIRAEQHGDWGYTDNAYSGSTFRTKAVRDLRITATCVKRVRRR